MREVPALATYLNGVPEGSALDQQPSFIFSPGTMPACGCLYVSHANFHRALGFIRTLVYKQNQHRAHARDTQNLKNQ